MNSPIKWHGGKYFMAKKIAELFPPRKDDRHPDGYLHYVETHGGSLAVMLANDPEGISEVANDLDKHLMNFWSVLQNKSLFDSFRRVMDATPFAQLGFESAAEILDGATPDIDYRLATGINDAPVATAVARACAFFVRCRQSMAGRIKDFAPLSKTRVRRGMNEQASAWLTAIEGLPKVHARLKRVVVLNGNALDVIKQEDRPDTLFYLDPPYHPATRAAPDVYRHEADLDHHRLLLEYLCNIKGKAILSGYDNPMYSEWLRDWHREEFDLPNNAAGGKEKRRMTEVLWMNYSPRTT